MYLLSSKAQLYRNEYPCSKVVNVDSIEYKKNFTKGKTLSKTNKYKKVKNQVSVTTKDTVFIFKDVFEKSGYRLYSFNVVREDTARHWVLVQQSDDQASSYHLINTKTLKIDILYNIPQIYGDKMICFEDEYTDGGNRIQIWNINEDNITLYKKYDSMKKCFMDLSSVYLNKNALYLKAEAYYKLDITK